MHAYSARDSQNMLPAVCFWQLCIGSMSQMPVAYPPFFPISVSHKAWFSLNKNAPLLELVTYGKRLLVFKNQSPSETPLVRHFHSGNKKVIIMSCCTFIAMIFVTPVLRHTALGGSAIYFQWEQWVEFHFCSGCILILFEALTLHIWSKY